MNKYKAGDKFIIEIKQPHIVCGDVRYECEGMVLWTPEEDLDNLSQLVQGVDQYSRMKGQQEAWELAQRIVKDPCDGGFTMDEIGNIFEYFSTAYAIKAHSYAEAAEMVEAWERKKEIQIGDVVKHPDGRCGLVWEICGNLICGITDEKTGFSWVKGKCTKTGRHIDIDSFIAQIGEENEPAEI